MALNNLGLGFLFTAKDMASGQVKGINSNIEQLANNSEKAQKSIESATATMGKGLKAVGAGTAVLAAAAVPVMVSANWEKGMSEVWTVTDVTKEKLTSMGDEALGVMAKYGEELGNTTTALYNTLSASIPVEKSIGFLDQAMKASVAGVSDANTAVDALSNVLNGYTNQSYTAAQASDMIFTAVKRGKTTFGEMAHSIGEVNSMADSLGLGFEHMSASFATLTKAGNNTSKAATMIKAALTAAMSKQEQAVKMGPKVAEAFSLENLKTKGIQKWMVEVMDAIGGSQEKLIKLVGSSEAASMFLAMTGKGAKTAAEDLAAMSNSAGATDTAFGKMSQTFDFQSKKATASTKALMVQVGSGLRDAITPIIGVVGDFVGTLAKWAKENKGLVTTIMKVVVGIGSMLVIGGIILFIKGAIMLLIAVIPGMVAGLGAMAVGMLSVLWPILAIVAVVYLLYKAWKMNLGGIQGIVMSFIDGIVSVFNILKTAVISIGQGIFDGFQEWIDPIMEPLKEAFGVLFVTIGEVFSKIGGLFGGLGDSTGKGGSKFMLFLKAMGNVVGQFLGIVATVIATVISWVVKLAAFWITVFITAGEIIGTFVGMVVVGIGKLMEWMSNAWDWISDSVSGVADSIGMAFVSAWEWIKNTFRAGAAFIIEMVTLPIRTILSLASKIPGIGKYAEDLKAAIETGITVVKGEASSGESAQSPPVAPAATAQAQGTVQTIERVNQESNNDAALKETIDAIKKQNERPIQTTVVLDGEKVNKTMRDRSNMDAERAFSPAGG